MTIKKVIGFVWMLTGTVIVTFAIATVLFTFYYRPTLEGPMSARLTGEVFSTLVAMTIGTVGGILIWAGGRWRRS